MIYAQDIQPIDDFSEIPKCMTLNHPNSYFTLRNLVNLSVLLTNRVGMHRERGCVAVPIYVARALSSVPESAA